MGFFEVFAQVLAFFYSIIPSYGLAIILLTLATRILLLPLSIKSTRSMREMQVIQPELKRLQKKYKGDRQKLNEEMMKLYKEHGVNPFGGCAPLLLQMPVFIALYNVIRSPVSYLATSAGLEIALRADWLQVNNFLGIRLDCSSVQALRGQGPAMQSEVVDALQGSPDLVCGSGWVSALPYLVLVLLMGATTFYQQRQMMAARSGSQDPQQQQMQTVMKVMPIILLVFGFQFPAGVVVYWLTTNLWTIVQQRIMLKAAPPLTAEATASKASSKAGGKKDKASSDGRAGTASPGTDGKTAKKTGGGAPTAGRRKSPGGKAAAGASPGSKGKKKKR